MYSRVTYYPSAGDRDGFVCGSNNANIAIFSDYRPKSLFARRGFWNRFLRSCAPHEIRLIAATPIARVFTIDRRKWGVFLFVDNNIAIEMIKRSGMKISTAITQTCGCTEGGNYECVNELPFFGKLLDLIPDDGGMYVITDHSPYLFQGTWGERRRGNFNFVLKDTVYNANLISDGVKGFRDRASEFIIRTKYQVNNIKDTIPLAS